MGWFVVALLLSPVLLAVWLVPGFTTQDGPAHAYNAWILAQSFTPDSPYGDYFDIQWQLFPNWVGHLALVGLFQVVSPRTADRILISLTLVGFAASMIWLRWKVAGDAPILGPSLLAALTSVNYLWLMGFTSFMLGCCLFPITLGVWWSGRGGLKTGQLLALLVLLTLGYFCHLVSLGLTVQALVFLAMFAPADRESACSWTFRWRRLGRTMIAFMPLLALGLVYLSISRRGGPMLPEWENLDSATSLAAWGARLGWVDPLSLAVKAALPFTNQVRPVYALLAPVVWLSFAGVLWWAGRLTSRSDDSGPEKREISSGQAADRIVWLVLAVFLIMGGIVGPDSLGPGHGEYLPQRLVLLGLAALVATFDLDLANRWGRLTAISMALAFAMQSVIVWDYAVRCQRTAEPIMAATDLVGRGKRIATVLHHIDSRFRVNSVLHADGWLGVGTGNIVWSDYETRHYYFPVQFRKGLDRPDSSDIERIAIWTNPEDAPRRAALWEKLLHEHGDAIDEVFVWRTDPAMDSITERRFILAAERGEVRVYRRRDPSPAKPPS